MKDLASLHPLDYLKITWRRRWYVLTVFVLVSAGVSIYAWRMPDVYVSEAVVAVESTPIPQDYVRPSDRSSPEERIAAIRQLVQSRTFLERMIQDFGIGYGPENRSMEAAIAALSRNIKVASLTRNHFKITYHGNDSDTAQKFTQGIVDRLIQAGKSTREKKATETDDFLEQQLRQTRDALTAHEDKIRQFKSANLGQLPEQSTAIMNALNGLHTQLMAVENAMQQARERQKLLDLRRQEQKRLDVLTRNMGLTSVVQDPVVAPPRESAKLKAKEAELAALSAKYTASHPDVVRLTREVQDLRDRLAAEMKVVSEESPVPPPVTELQFAESDDSVFRLEAESISNEIAKREQERNAILTDIRRHQAKLNLAPTIEQQMLSLSREHEILKKQYESLTSKKFQAEMTAKLERDSATETYIVIDGANKPDKPAFPNRTHTILMGLGAGLVLGICAGFGRELLDTAIGGEDEAAAILKLPVLVCISEIPAKESKRLSAPGGMLKSA